MKLNSNIHPATFMDIVPIWLEAEMAHAARKHGAVNPQRSALSGGLEVGGKAWMDIMQYHDRASEFIDHSDGDSQVLVRGSQALGKHLNATRALLVVIVQARRGINDRLFSLFDDEADRLVGDGMSVGLRAFKGAVAVESADEVRYGLSAVHEDLANSDLTSAIANCINVMQVQAQMFGGLSLRTGLLATPGIDSTDPNNQLGNWMAN